MALQSKQELVASLREELQNAAYLMVVNYEGTSVNNGNEFRRGLDGVGARLQVVKNTLARRAIDETDLAEMSSLFKGMTGIIVGPADEPVATAKAVREALKDLDTIEVLGGFFDGEVLDAQGIKGVADMPSREELLVSLLRTIQEPGRQVLGVLQAPARDLLYLLKNYATKLEEG